jgi:hypothetical protein
MNTQTEEIIAAFGDLPEVFIHRNDDGTIEQVKEPCYNLLAPGFYGIGQDGTFYDEGEIIRTNACPNYHMQPLNQAAGKKIVAWLESLPTTNVMINIEDMVEASQMLAKDPRITTMTTEEVQSAAIKLAMALKSKREGNGGLSLPPVNGPTLFSRAGASKAPPMLATRFVDPAMRGPGQTGNRDVLHEPKAQPASVKRQKAAMGGVPIRDGAQR